MKRAVFRLGIPLLTVGIALWVLFALLSSPARAEEQISPAQTVTVLGSWSGSEQDSFTAVLDEFTNRTGFSTSYTQSSDVRNLLLNCTASSTCPDVAIIGDPVLLNDLVKQGALVPLDPIVSNFDTYYTKTWRTLASVEGTLYSVPFKADYKSMFWYRPQAFNAISATIPQTWAALLNLSDNLVADSQTPFSIGAESGGASGWPLTDWFENILLRVGGPSVHRSLVHHDIPWTDPTVVEAMQRFSEIVGQNDYQVGGITGTLTTNFSDAIDPVFGSSPTAAMYFEGGWVKGAIVTNYPTLTPVTDYNFFIFPEIKPALGKPLIGSADFVVLFHNTTQAQSLLQFLATPDAAGIWAARGDYLSPNSGVNINTYPDELSRSQTQQLIEAHDFVFDLDDQLPSGLQTYEWNAMMEFVAHQDQMMTILQGIETKATELQGPPPHKTFLPATLNN